MLTGSPGSYTAQDFVTGMGGGSAVSLLFGPYQGTQALYYTTYAGGGSVNVLAYGNQAPVAAISAAPTNNTAPLNVNFNGSTSTDPNGNNTISNYIWNFGDGSPTVTTTTATTSHIYAVGTYTATLKVRDNLGLLSANTASVGITATNTFPTPVIDTPDPATTFAVGDTISLTGHGTDPQDGNLPQSALAWYVIIHDGGTTYPFRGPVYGNNSFPMPAPNNLPAAATSYLEIQLKATDANGAGTVITQALQPKKVNITFATNPAGGFVSVNSTTINNTPKTVVSWQNYVLNVTVPQQTVGVDPKVFDSWADLSAGNPDLHSAFRSITTPANATTYTANFKPNTTCNDPTLVTEFNLDDINLCGTLRYAVANAPAGSLIDLSAATTISLNGTLNISRGLTLQGKSNCSTGTGVTIQANGAALNPGVDGLILSGGIHLKGLTINQFGGRQLVLTGGTGSVSNKLECTIVSKT